MRRMREGGGAMSEIKLRCATCGAEPRIYLERYEGRLYLASRCDECTNFMVIDKADELGSLLAFWEEVDE